MTVRRIGNQKHYQANALAPIFVELRDLVLKTPGLVDILAPRLMVRERSNEKAQQSVAEGIATRMTGSPVEKHAVCILPAMIEPLRGDIAQLCKRYGVRELALFGSVLRSDFSPTSSDVDAVVNFGPPADGSLARQYFDFKTALERLLSRPVDLVELEAMPDTRLKRIIERTKVPIYATA